MAIQRRVPSDDHEEYQRFVSSSLLSYADIRIVCHQSTDLGKSTFAFQSIESQIKGQRFPDQLSNELPRIDIQLGRRHPFNQSETFPSRKSQESRRGRELEGTKFESQPRYASLEATFVCDGWCEYNDVPHANIVSIGRPLQEHSDLMLAGRSLCPPARTCTAPGKAQGAR